MVVVVDEFRTNVAAGRTHFDRVRSADGHIIAGYESTGIGSLVCLSQRARKGILLDVVHAAKVRRSNANGTTSSALPWRVGYDVHTASWL